MTAAVEQLFNSVMNLPEDQLRELTDALNELEQSEQDFVLTPEWKVEIQRRSDLIDAGKSTSAEWPIVRARVWEHVMKMVEASE